MDVKLWLFYDGHTDDLFRLFLGYQFIYSIYLILKYKLDISFWFYGQRYTDAWLTEG